MNLRNVDPPLRVAWRQAVASLRIRFGRHLVTVLGIGLGIAFFASVQTYRSEQRVGDSFEAQRLQWLAATSLLMCLVGVTNSMLISVTERYREIGTMKCLGASDGFIVKVFCLEALLIGLVGSVGGAALGAIAVSAFYGFGPSVPAVILTSSGLGMGMTLLAAISPAVQAARMPAAAALRVEI